MENIIAEIMARIEAMAEKDSILVAIDGSCASGKSTLSERLSKKLDCNLFRMDDFFLRPSQRTPERLAEPGGNVDYERFREEVLQPLKTGSAFTYRPYDCGTGMLSDPVAVTPRRINIVEGSYSQHPYFAEPYDLKVFLKVSPEIRKERILHRPVFLQSRFFESWIPMEETYFKAFDIEEKADFVGMPEDNR